MGKNQSYNYSKSGNPDTSFVNGGYYSAKLLNPAFSKIFLYWCYGILFLFILCLFLPWTQNISSSGKVTTFRPEHRPQTIHTTIAGRIEKWYVQEGQLVKKGDTIVRLSEVKDKYFDPNFLSRINEQISAKDGVLRTTKEKAEALTSQIKALEEGRKVSLEKARNKINQVKLKVKSDSMDFKAVQAELEISKVQYERQEKLYAQGLKSLAELESRRLKLQESTAKLVSYENKFFASKNELVNARLELNSINAEYLDKISKAEAELNSTLAYYYNTEGEVSKINNEYSNMRIRSSFYQIIAPQDGYVVKALVTGIGETVKEGDAIVSILPARIDKAVELYVKPMDIPLLSKGRKVRLRFDGWPALVFSGWPGVTFGTFGGLVAVIDNVDSEGKYRILVVPDPSDHPWPEQVRVGSGAYGWAMLNDVPVWYELWRQVNGFPPDYLGPVTKKETKEKAKKAVGKEETDIQ